MFKRFVMWIARKFGEEWDFGQTAAFSSHHFALWATVENNELAQATIYEVYLRIGEHIFQHQELEF